MPRFNFTFQEASPLITYSGFWMEGSKINDSSWDKYDGSFRVTNSSGATATLKFIGTGVSIFGAKRPNHGGYSVNLDQDLPTNGDGASVPPGIFKNSLWDAYNLASEEHNVEITNLPTSAPYFDLDYVQIEREIGRDNDTIQSSPLDDINPLVRYNGSWVSSFAMGAQNYNGTIQQTNNAGSQLSITFQGASIELYGSYANAGYTVRLDDQPPESMQGMDIDLDPEMWHPQTLLYLKDGLQEGVNHTVTLTATENNPKRPFSFDYAMVRTTQDLFSMATPSSSPSSQSSSLSTQSPNSPSASQATPVALILGLSVGGTGLLALIVLAYLLLSRRRRRLQARRRVDLMPETEEREVAAPSPWMSLGQSHPAPPSTWQLSSVISGWRRLSRDGQSTTDSEGLRSPTGGYPTCANSNTTASRRSLPPPPSTPFVRSLQSGGHKFAIANP